MVDLPDLCFIPPKEPFQPVPLEIEEIVIDEIDKNKKHNLNNLLLDMAKNKYCKGE